MRQLIFLSTFFFFSCEAFAQNTGIGTTRPSEKLEVNGNIKLDTLKPDAIKMAPNAAKGKVLTSDASGNATWQFPQPAIYKASGFDVTTSISEGESYVLKDWSNFDVLSLGGSNYIFNPGNGDFFVLSAGTYRVTVKLTFFAEVTSSAIGNVYSLGIHKNGNATSMSEIYEKINSRGYYTFQLSTIANLAEQDYLRFILTNVSGTTAVIDGIIGVTARRSEFIVEKLK